MKVMKEHEMSRLQISVIAAPAFYVALTAGALADAAAERMVNGALPLMYHSCRSVVAEAAGNTKYIDKVVRGLVAVSLYSRDVPIAKFQVGDDRKTAMHDAFVKALKKGCEADKDALLAGVVDQAVAEAIR